MHCTQNVNLISWLTLVTRRFAIHFISATKNFLCKYFNISIFAVFADTQLISPQMPNHNLIIFTLHPHPTFNLFIILHKANVKSQQRLKLIIFMFSRRKIYNFFFAYQFYHLIVVHKINETSIIPAIFMFMKFLLNNFHRERESEKNMEKSIFCQFAFLIRIRICSMVLRKINVTVNIN